MGKVTVTATGTITNAGAAVNTYTIDWGAVDSDKYDVTEDLGTLTVTKDQLTYDLGGCTAMYSGYPFYLEDLSCTASSGDMVAMDALSVIYDGEHEPEGVEATFLHHEVDLIRLSYPAYADLGAHTVTPEVSLVSGNSLDNYDIIFTNNVLEIKIFVEFDLGGTEWIPITYDGWYHGAELCVSSDYEGFEVEQQSSTVWRLTWDYGDIIDVTVTGGGTNAGTYSLTCSYSFVNGKEANYDISIVNTSLTINPASMSISTGSYSRAFDGTPLTYDDGWLDGLIVDGSPTSTPPPDFLNVTGSITDVGTADNTYSIDWTQNSGDSAGNYDITESLGTLEVEPLEVEFTAVGGSIKYDGEYHAAGFSMYCENDEYEVEQVDDDTWRVTWNWGDIIDVTVSGGGTYVGTYTPTCTYEFNRGKSSNYSISVVKNAVEIYTPDDNSLYIDMCGDYTWYSDPEGVIPTVTQTGYETVYCEFLDVTYNSTDDITRRYQFYVPMDVSRGPVIIEVRFTTSYWSGGEAVWTMMVTDTNWLGWESHPFIIKSQNNTIGFTPPD